MYNLLLVVGIMGGSAPLIAFKGADSYRSVYSCLESMGLSSPKEVDSEGTLDTMLNCILGL